MWKSSTVYKKKGRGGWYGDAVITEGGARTKKTVPLAARNKTEARALLEKEVARLNAGHLPLTNKTPAAEYALRLIDERVAADEIERSTATGYRRDIRAWEPYIEAPISQLTPEMVEAALSDWRAKGHAYNTIRSRYVCLQTVCRIACERGDLERTPFDRVRKPRPVKKRPNAAMDADLRREMVRTVSAMGKRPATVGMMVALCTGMRRGEIAALQVGDVDFKRHVIQERRAIGIDNGTPYVKSDKTRSVRDVPMLDQLEAYLSEWIAELADGNEKIGSELSPTDWLCAWPKGDHAAPNTISRTWSALADAMGWKGSEGRTLTLHDLRHTFASWLVTVTDVKTAQSILGHASAQTTLDIYAAADPSAAMEAARRISEALE